MNVLALTYWSYKEPLIHAATLPYLKMMRSHLGEDDTIFLLTLEKPSMRLKGDEHRRIREELRAEGIELITRRYYRFGLRAMIAWMAYIIGLALLIVRHRIKIIHAFGTPVGSAAHVLHILTGCPYVVDSYEPHADSMVENGSWKPNSIPYRLLFYFEGRIARKAHAVLATTEGMRDYARKTFGTSPHRFFVKPACVDIDQFKPGSRDSELENDLGLEGKLVCVYAGKIGGIYLREEIFSFFKSCLDTWPDDFKALLLTDAPDQLIDALCHQVGLARSAVIARNVPHEDVPEYLRLADFALNPVKPVPSKRYCTSIKDGEYWATGLPVVITPNISDDSEIIEREGIGAILDDLNSFDSAIGQLKSVLERKETIAEKIRSVAVRYRSTAIAEACYHDLYSSAGILEKGIKRFFVLIYNSYRDPLFQNLMYQYLRDQTTRHLHYEITLITYEQKKYALSKSEYRDEKSRLLSEGIHWNPLTYHSGYFMLIKKAYDFLLALLLSIRDRILYKPNLIVAFANTSASICVILSKITGIPMMVYSFEPHSEFLAEFGIWKKSGWRYRILSRLENQASRHADYLLTGTHHMVKELEGKTKAQVFRAPSSVDPEVFIFDGLSRSSIRNELGVEQRKVLIYTGKFGGIYYEKEIPEFFSALNRIDPTWYFVVLTPSDKEVVTRHFTECEISQDHFWIGEASSAAEVRKYLSAADAGITAIPPLPNQKYRSPVKVGEYLMCGLPYITCKGVSEDDEMAEKYDVGVVINELDPKYAERCASELNRLSLEGEPLRTRCREAGLEYRGIDQVNDLFEKIFRESSD